MCGIVFVGVGVGDGSDGEVLARGGCGHFLLVGGWVGWVTEVINFIRRGAIPDDTISCVDT